LLQNVEKIYLWTGDDSFDGNVWPAMTTLKELNLNMCFVNCIQNILPFFMTWFCSESVLFFTHFN